MLALEILSFILHSPTSALVIPSPRSDARDTKRTLGEPTDRNSDLDPDNNNPVLSVLRQKRAQELCGFAGGC